MRPSLCVHKTKIGKAQYVGFFPFRFCFSLLLLFGFNLFVSSVVAVHISYILFFHGLSVLSVNFRSLCH